MLCGARAGGALPLVRVAGPADRAGMQQSLDLGAAGVMVPSVDTAADALAAVGCCKLPPEGGRSIFYHMRTMHAVGLGAYLASANAEALVAVQVETAACLDNLADVLAVPRVDAAFVGPVDLAYSMGLPAKYGGSLDAALGSREYADAIDHVLDCCAAAGVVPGNFAFPSNEAGALAGRGFQMLAAGTDMGLLLAATAEQFRCAGG